MVVLLTLIASCASIISPFDISQRSHGAISFGEFSAHNVYVTDKYSVDDLDLFIRCFYVAFKEVYKDPNQAVLARVASLTIITTNGPWKVRGTGTDINGIVIANPQVQGMSTNGSTIIIKEEPTLQLTPLAHELTHQALMIRFNDSGYEHNDNFFWKQGADRTILITNELFRQLKEDNDD